MQESIIKYCQYKIYGQYTIKILQGEHYSHEGAFRLLQTLNFKPKIKNMFLKYFFISTKVKSKRIEHLQDQEFISSELYFSTNIGKV